MSHRQNILQISDVSVVQTIKYWKDQNVKKQVNAIGKYNTPIFNYLREYAEQDINIFHMPGHKLAKGMPLELVQDVLRLDVTEVEGTDNLHYPEGIIKQAQELAARAFGADRTYFLVNGSTCGIQAAIMSSCDRGQKIIIGRDSHKAVVSGLILSGAEPVFVYPDYNTEFEIVETVTAESIEASLRANPDAAAVMLTRPNYYGICSDIEEIGNIVHSYNKLLIVDEAHGAHLAFNAKLPPSALEHQADICIQSAHKTLPAVTQGAYLHIKGGRVDRKRLEFNLAMLQSSSPSYIIMSYLDIARELMELEGDIKLDELLDNINWFKHRIGGSSAYKILSGEDIRTGYRLDPTRLVINVTGLGISGYEAERILRNDFSTQVEMADNKNITLIATIADDHKTFERLAGALEAMGAGQVRPNAKVNCSRMNMQGAREGTLGCAMLRTARSGSDINEINTVWKAERAKLPWEAYAAPKEEVPLGDGQGRICAEILTPYPPGIPVLYPGEILGQRQIRYISEIIEAGERVNGVSSKQCVRVLK